VFQREQLRLSNPSSNMKHKNTHDFSLTRLVLDPIKAYDDNDIFYIETIQ